jgi:hypothetical protein
MSPIPSAEPRNALMMPEEMAEAQLRAAFEISVLMKGAKATSQLLRELQKKPVGRPKGPTNPERDQQLLSLYDWLKNNPDQSIKSVPQWIGQKVHKDFPHKYGATANAIAIKVRRLVKKREEAAARAGPPRNLLDPNWQNK